MHEMAKLLSIIMPTFDRNIKAIANIKRLLPQLTEEVELLILDNHSPIPISKTIQEELPAHDHARVKVIRNIANIGMTGNSLRFFEVGGGEFIWSLCDDDVVDPTAVQTILLAIRQNADATYLWFPVKGGPPHRQPGRHAGMCAAVQAEPNLFFVALSCCVFSRRFFASRLRIGYLYSYSWASFMCPLLAEIDNTDNIVFVGDRIVAVAGAVDSDNKWSKLDACLGMRTLLELPMSKASRQQLEISIDSFTFSTARLFLDSVAINNDQRWYLFRMFVTRRYVPFSTSLAGWLIACRIAEIAPQLVKSLIHVSERLIGRRLLFEVEDRFGRS